MTYERTSSLRRTIAALICAPALYGWYTTAEAACTVGRLLAQPSATHRAITPDLSIVYSAEVLTHQLNNRDDDHDGIPDLAQNASVQVAVAERWFTKLFGGLTPLRTPRYKDVQAIQLCLERLSQGNGQAISPPICESNGNRSSNCVLRIRVGAHVRPRNLSPAHELFHLYQYAQTEFKHAWLLEGTARWAEGAFSEAAPTFVHLPQDEAELAAMLRGGYETGRIWNRLTQLLDPEGTEGLTPEETPEKYVSGERVWPARRIHGATFMSDLFAALGQADKALLSSDPTGITVWTEELRRSPRWNPVLWETVRRVARVHAARIPPSAELNRFISLEFPFSLASAALDEDMEHKRLTTLNDQQLWNPVVY